jgi:predicted lipid-binding transport protein (Tim44 family)
MSEPLFTQHTETLRGQEARGERNVIEQIVIRNAEIVFLRYANDTAQREFAMLFEVSMIDYYARRDSGALLRGSRTPSIFQEVWWFRQSRDGWSLDKIEQTGETRVLEMTDVDETGSERGVG